MNGDTCKIASSIAVDSMTIACAPIKVGDQGTLGASSVLLPGTTVGAQATLAPLASPAVGSVVEPKTINIGAPSSAVKVNLKRDTSSQRTRLKYAYDNKLYMQ